MTVITLMTDFGIKDGNVGVMKGVIWGISPGAKISDLSHMIGAQNIREAALVLARSAPYFPKDTVHVVVVDPGVGTSRRPMAARIGDWFYVGPDNGTITLLLERAEQEGWTREFVQLDKSQYWLTTVSFVFHGRDIFSPVAAHLANGVSLQELGTAFANPIRLKLPKPTQTKDGWSGEIIHVDHFGNLASNIRVENLGTAMKQKEKIQVRVKGMEIKGMVNTFGERNEGEVVALLGSTGNLIISVVNGDAAARLGAKVGDGVEADLQSLTD
jgi:S-adenosyl-L-methionine hydrolase (adenosine-forming)